MSRTALDEVKCRHLACQSNGAAPSLCLARHGLRYERRPCALLVRSGALYRAVYGAAVARALLPFTSAQDASNAAAGMGEETSTYTAEVQCPLVLPGSHVLFVDSLAECVHEHIVHIQLLGCCHLLQCPGLQLCRLHLRMMSAAACSSWHLETSSS